MHKFRLLLADDHLLIREALVRLLESEFDLVAAVGNGQSAIEEAERHKPDVVVLDIGLPVVNGLDAARRIRRILPSVILVMVTQQAGKEYVQAAMRAGASAYVLKNAAAAELKTALREALDGRFYISRDLRDKHVDTRDGLSGREREVIQLLAEGKSVEQTAGILGVSATATEVQKASIMEHLHLHSVAELTRYAVDHGIVK